MMNEKSKFIHLTKNCNKQIIVSKKFIEDCKKCDKEFLAECNKMSKYIKDMAD